MHELSDTESDIFNSTANMSYSKCDPLFLGSS